MKKFLVGLTVVFGFTFIAVAPAIGAQGNPHQEETDGCDHGATGKPCKDDPQPDHGKDCDVHGNHGGVNEDHCSGEPTTTTTQPEDTTTTTETEVTTATTTTQPVEVTTTTEPAPVVTTTTQPTPVVTQPLPVSVEAPHKDCVTVDGFPFKAETCPAVVVDVTQPTAPVSPVPVSELPHTGLSGWLAVVGLVFLFSGLFSIGMGKVIKGVGVQ